jgi:large subunit ribosomal protein L4e
MGVSRVPRKILNYRGTRFNWVAATVPYAVGGRQAHPPLVEKNWDKKINTKERRKAIRSAMAATAVKEIVTRRGHVVTNDYPLVLEDSVEDLTKSKEILSLLVKLGLQEELIRSSKTSPKTGKAKMRGRTVKHRIGPLFVVSKKCSLVSAAGNLPGVDVVNVDSLNAEILAPGCDYGRLTIYTKGAIEKLEKDKLFMDGVAVILKEEKTEKPKKAKEISASEKPKRAVKKKPVAEE